MKLEVYKDIELLNFFFEDKNHSSFSLRLVCSLCCSFYFWHSKNISNPPPVWASKTHKSVNFVKEWEKKYWKVFDNKYVFDEGQFYPNLAKLPLLPTILK
jgi:hypothetical protein